MRNRDEDDGEVFIFYFKVVICADVFSMFLSFLFFFSSLFCNFFFIEGHTIYKKQDVVIHLVRKNAHNDTTRKKNC